METYVQKPETVTQITAWRWTGDLQDLVGIPTENMDLRGSHLRVGTGGYMNPVNKGHWIVNTGTSWFVVADDDFQEKYVRPSDIDPDSAHVIRVEVEPDLHPLVQKLRNKLEDVKDEEKLERLDKYLDRL